jgi:hypothetical protein
MGSNYRLNNVGSNVASILSWNQSADLQYIFKSNVRIYSDSIKIAMGTTNLVDMTDNHKVQSLLLNNNKLFYNTSNKKLETVSNGITIIGNLTATSINENTSDIRLKDIIGTIDNPIQKITNISCFKYYPSELAKQMYSLEDRLQIGLSAQDVQKCFPEVVCENSDGFLAVSYSRIIPVLVECIKELNTNIDSLYDSHVKNN